MTVVLLVLPLVLILYALIFSLTQIKHSPPQAYYLKRKRGATIALMSERGSEPDNPLVPFVSERDRRP